MRLIYRILSILGIMKAAAKGPGPLVNNYIRRKSHKMLAKGLKKVIE